MNKLPEHKYFTTKTLIKYLLIFVFLVVIFENKASGQSDNINHQVWLDFYPHFYINENLEYYGDTGFRTIVSEKSWNRVYARPSLRYQSNSIWEFHAGIGFFYIFDKQDYNRFEITLWQGIQANWPSIGSIKFKHLGKLEERFSTLSNSGSNSFDLRFRYKLSGKLNFQNKVGSPNWYVPFYSELFFPINDQIVEFYRNRGRGGTGIGYKLNKEWDISILFNWQTSRAGPENELNVSDYAYQLKIKKLWKN